MAELARVSKQRTNGANCANARLGTLCCARTAGQLCSRHLDTKVHLMLDWAMEPGQRFLNVHSDSQQVVDCLTKITTLRAADRKAFGL